ncbi:MULTISPECIES: peptide MFS transporter [unclassified Francisella]|uniref:peptide MFS transporter n=1 Tax=unclassified Francisella TaxID=2610885 RepID=UPI002E358C93|nr:MULTISPECIES: oligopeptide:H+ symporter [unclassified Francisella]MED7819783.1 oligopeptide:H+ symporter [Francisella sp. 19S2-4]MED7830603.1 oligopeptide:H+ symporter [Francisella sp. 19S2-10]
MSNFFNQPKAFYTIFMLEIWERFGYGALIAILVVYLQVGGIHLSESGAIATYAAFAALVYAFIVLGGYIGDMILGAKRTILLGLIILLSGYALLILEDKESTLWGLSFICVGTGLFKSNPTSLLAKCYVNSDSGQISNAFTLFYMAINIGSLLGMLVIPTIARSFGYSSSFIVISMALILAIMTFVGFGFTMKNIYTYAGGKKLNYKYLFSVIVGVAIMIYIVKFLLAYILIAKLIVILTFLVSLFVYIYLAFLYKKDGYFYKMMLALILMCEAMVYKISYIQMASSINLFTIKNTDHSILGLSIAPETFQSFNPFWIFVLSPLLAFYYVRSENSRFDISVYGKFSIGLFSIGLSFIVLYFSRFTATEGVTSAYWLVCSYALQALGELLISAIGLSMFTKLAPAKVNGFMIGVWWVFLAFASILGGIVAQVTAIDKSQVATMTLNTSLVDYTNFFLSIGIVIVVVSLLSFKLSPFKRKLMNQTI